MSYVRYIPIGFWNCLTTPCGVRYIFWYYKSVMSKLLYVIENYTIFYYDWIDWLTYIFLEFKHSVNKVLTILHIIYSFIYVNYNTYAQFIHKFYFKFLLKKEKSQ